MHKIWQVKSGNSQNEHNRSAANSSWSYYAIHTLLQCL